MKNVQLAAQPSPQNLPFRPISSNLSRTSPRTFRHCLTALLANTSILNANLISLHLQLAEQPEDTAALCQILSDFHLDLAVQTWALESQIGECQSETQGFLQPYFSNYAEAWRFSENEKTVLPALGEIVRATDFLSGLYENLLSVAARQADKHGSLYLLSFHLFTLVGHLRRLENFVDKCEHFPTTAQSVFLNGSLGKVFRQKPFANIPPKSLRHFARL